MLTFASNRDNAKIPTVEFLSAPEFVSNRQGRSWVNHTNRPVLNTDTFIGLELCLVPEVESVFVDREKSGKQVRITVVVDKRDPAVRAKVYAREQAIIDEYPNLEFDFHVVSRMGRDLKDITDTIGKLAFSR